MELGFWSVFPPLLTIVLALVTKNVFLSLLIGIITGCTVLSGGLFFGINDAFYSIAGAMTQGNTLIIGSVLMTAAIIYLAEKSGGIEGFVQVVVKRKGLIKTKRGANLFTWLLGLVVFTSGTLSCMVTGSVSRPVNDSLKVPREKAAFIVHTTSTPWCVLFPFSGWLAAMAGYLVSGGVPEAESVGVLFKSIFLNFYCIMAIALVPVLAITGKDFGPMAKAEKRAAETGALEDPRHAAKHSDSEKAETSGVTPRAINLLLPVGVLIGVMFIALFVTGNGNLMNGAGTQALIWAVAASLLCAAILCLVEKVFKPSEIIDEIFNGMKGTLPIAFILLLGFTMGNIVKSLDTGAYLSSLFQSFLSPALLPALTFLIAVLISFATGTSMGTMAIMAVLAIPMAIDMGTSLPLVAGAMFGGSIFGDHASPISDTTIMTCSTTGCDIIDHIKTQFPYVAVLATITFVLYVIVGFVA